MYRYYELEVRLREVEPRIWRRLVLRADSTFFDLHKAIQDACGWQDYHLFAFRVDDQTRPLAGVPLVDEFDGTKDPDAKKVKLASYFEQHQSIEYEYDFGDSWHHDVKLVGSLELPYKFKRALLAGERSFPPEDCGGSGGYERLVHFFKTGEDEWDDDTEGLREWLGGWTPEGFNLDRTKAKFDR